MKEFGILFDYNGVLVDDEYLQEEAMVQIVARYSGTLTATMYNEQCFGRPDREAFERLKTVVPILQTVSTPDLVEQKVAAYHQLIRSKTILYSAVQELIKNLSAEFTLAVVTGSLRAEVEPVLQQGNVEQYFQAVITADDIQQGKPDPEGYLKGVHALGLPKESIVVIEDSPAGIQAAKAAGLKCIAVTRTAGIEPVQAADYLLEKVTDLSREIVHKVLAT